LEPKPSALSHKPDTALTRALPLDEALPIVRQIADALARRVRLDGRRLAGHTLHMKRTNLVIREELLEEAVRLSGERTYSRTVERALEDFVRRVKARRILELAGTGFWEGDLAVVREDRASEEKPKRRGRGPR
jgi:hypothetical protein